MGGGGMKGSFDPLTVAGEGGQELGQRVRGSQQFPARRTPCEVLPICYPNNSAFHTTYSKLLQILVPRGRIELPTP